MQIIKGKTNFDFIGKRRIALFISSILNLGIIVGIALFGFNFGVDFAGGTLVELKFPYSIDSQKVRQGAEKGGLHDPTVQGIGSSDENSFLLRMGGVTQLTKEGAAKAEAAVRGLGPVTTFSSDLDNGILQFRTKEKLHVDPPAPGQPIDATKIRGAIAGSGTGVNEVRFLGETQGGGYEYQVVSAGMADKVQEALKKGLEKPEFEVRRVDYVGPQVGKQLRNKGVMALMYAMVAILVYIAFRFDFKFGPGALAAMVHDVIMVAGYFLISRREFNLTSIAVLLTIIGYSVNDTIVIYDRIREEMVRYKGKPLPEIINIAINDTLSRTILTSGVTALSLVGLLIFGVGEIWDFAAAMLLGIIVGTYSSVYIASPLTIWLDERAAAKKQRGSANKPAMNAKTA
ncbi:MAG: protein translocase subunit SecF [Myxococcaceae bacterium]